MRSGFGVQLWPLPAQGGVITYSGDWSEDKRHGFGKLNFPDGRCYEGGWFDGKMQGTGALTYAPAAHPGAARPAADAGAPLCAGTRTGGPTTGSSTRI